MANTLRFKRGLVATIPTALAGEPLFTTDTFDLYIGNGTTNTRFQKYIASGTTSQLLRGDGSLLTMPIVLTSPSNGQVLKFNGTNWVNDSDSGITGSLTTNYLPKATGATTLGNSLVFDNGTNVGIGTASPDYTLTIQVAGLSTLGLIDSTEATNQKRWVFQYGTPIGAGTFRLRAINDANSDGQNAYIITRSATSVQTHQWLTAGSERARIFATGNFGIGTGATDSGEKLQVTGDGYFSGGLRVGIATADSYSGNPGSNNITLSGSSNPTTAYPSYTLRNSDGSAKSYWWLDRNFGSLIGTSTNHYFGFFTNNIERARITSGGNILIGSSTDSGERLQVTGTAKITGATSIGGNLTVDTNTLFVDATNNRVGILTTSPARAFHVVGSGLFTDGTNDVTIWNDGYIGTNANLPLGFRTNSTEKMRLDASGNLGIGSNAPDARLRVASASANSTQAIFGNVDGRGLLIATSSIAGTNDAGTILNARGATSGTFIFQTDGTQRMQLDANGLEFPNNRGLLFDNSSASAVGSIKMGTGTTNPLEITNGTNTITLVTIGTAISSNLLVGAFNVGTSATNTLVLGTGTAPSSSPTDVVQMYSADITSGNAAPHFRTENGAVIKLYQQDNGVAAANYVSGIGSAVTTLDAFDGYTIGQVVKALRNAGILS